MVNLDRFAYGLPDTRALPVKRLGKCAKCGAEIYPGDGGVALDDEIFCSTYCLAMWLGAEFLDD